ncbi:hypothetical protein F2P81_008628 [Scophthalmus maximus]|uniref:Uncharacterized protein n=1 Tax=Scophthalmus maximus TaxID=52904 RepID=A0A6A4T4I3_SCOMX|nr:hypothetical protein F2P81_008628 [Scophthalmus maximus]
MMSFRGDLEDRGKHKLHHVIAFQIRDEVSESKFELESCCLIKLCALFLAKHQNVAGPQYGKSVLNCSTANWKKCAAKKHLDLMLVGGVSSTVGAASTISNLTFLLCSVQKDLHHVKKNHHWIGAGRDQTGPRVLRRHTDVDSHVTTRDETHGSAPLRVDSIVVLDLMPSVTHSDFFPHNVANICVMLDMWTVFNHQDYRVNTVHRALLAPGSENALQSFSVLYALQI